MPHWTLRFVVGVLASAFCTLMLLVNVGAMAGGSMVIRVAGPQVITTSYYVAGGGLFVTALIVFTWRQKVRRNQPVTQTPSGVGLSAILVRLAVVWLLVCPVWCGIGVVIIRSQVKLFRDDGDWQLLDRKVVETERGAAGFRLYRLGPSGGAEYTLVVKKHLLDEVRRTFEADGAAVHPIGW